MKATNPFVVKGARAVASMAKFTALRSNSTTCFTIFNQPKVPVGLKNFGKKEK